MDLFNLIDLLEVEEIIDKIVLICGGPRISHELAKGLGFDAGFGPNTFSEYVAIYFVKIIYNRKSR